MIRAAVIGGGASGLAAALSAARHGASVILLEAEIKCGKKLALTGNGRCNIAPGELADAPYQGGGALFAEDLLRSGREELFAFFASAGIEVRRIREGYYPRSEEAADVLRLLLSACIREGVKVHPNTPVLSVRKENGVFRVRTSSYEYEADRVILGCGSPAGSAEGAAATGYALAAENGHTTVPVSPALVPLNCSGLPFGKLSGCRVRADLTLLSQERCCGKSSGQILFTPGGLSGIAVLDLSGRAGGLLSAGEKPVLRIDLFPEYTGEEIAGVLKERGKILPAGELLTGLLPKKAADVFVSRFAAERLPSVLKDLRVTVTSLRPMAYAQACSGGIPFTQIDPASFGSLICPGLFLCGEMLDAVGICGGYNLSFAFLSGLRAGREAARA